MRWESLFDDLESQLQGEIAAQLREEITQSIRAEQATETLAERLEKLAGQMLRLQLGSKLEVSGRLGPLGDGYLCIDSEAADWVINLQALRRLSIAAPRAGTRRCRVNRSKIKLPTLLRGIMRDRSRVQICARNGDELAEGTMGQVGKDFLVMLVHPRDEFARDSAVSEQAVIPLDAIGWVVIPKGI